MALLIPILIAGLAFGAELGFWELDRRKMQNAADTAAHAAAVRRRAGVEDNDQLKAAAAWIAEAGGYPGGTAGVTIETPPSAGTYAGNDDAVRVLIAHSIPRRFSGIFTTDPVTFTVSATALIAGGRLACVLALAPSMAGAVSIGGSTDVELDGCDVVANSTSSSAIQTTGNAASLEASCVTTAGGISDSHGVIDLSECEDAYENAPTVPDPYGDVSEPAVSGCVAFSNFTAGGNPATPTPRCYNLGGNQSPNKDITLSPGVYIFNGPGELRLNGNRSMTGTGVTMFFANGASLSVSGNFDLDIKAPTSGPYSGLAIFGARNNTSAFDLTGNSGVAVVGAIYTPAASVTFTGNSAGFGSGECTQVVGYSVTFWGSAEFDTDCSNSGTRQVTTAQTVQLVE